MEKYLLSILNNNNRVIVPEFGAFIIKQRKPLNIVFNEFLQYNDGQLIDTLVKEEGLDKEQAKQKIDEFVVNINKTLNKGESYNLGKLGLLVKSPTGKISLEEGDKSEPVQKSKKAKPEIIVEQKKEKKNKEETIKPDKDPKSNTESGVLEKETPKPIEKTIAPAEKKASEVPETKTEVDGKKKTEEVHEEKPEKRTGPEIVIPKKEEPTVHTKSEAKQVASTQDLSKQRIVEPPQRSILEDVPTAPYTKPAKKTRVILWIAIIIIVNGAIISYFVFNEEPGKFFGKQEINTEIFEEPIFPEENDKAIELENLPVATEETVNKIQSVEKPAAPKNIQGPKYYVIAGVFRNKQNADQLTNDLKDKGFNAQSFASSDGLNYVSYEVFSNKGDADKLLLRLKKDTDPAAWIKFVK